MAGNSPLGLERLTDAQDHTQVESSQPQIRAQVNPRGGSPKYSSGPTLTKAIHRIKNGPMGAQDEDVFRQQSLAWKRVRR